MQPTFLEQLRKLSANTGDNESESRQNLWFRYLRVCVFPEQSGSPTSTRLLAADHRNQSRVILWLRIYDQYAGAPVALRTSFKSAKLGWHSDSRTSQGTENLARAEQLLLYISYRNQRTCEFPLRVNFANDILIRCLVITAWSKGVEKMNLGFIWFDRIDLQASQ
jgi:hypothetical protein